MQIIWYGHSCFLIKNSIGKKILIDPFNDLLGYTNNFPKCDLILTSHSHFSHSYLNKINTATKVINTPGFFNFSYVQITALNSFHDEYQGLKRGDNIIYSILLDNLTICHLGDLGYIPPSSLLDKLSNVDILFVPIGGQFTLDGKSAAKLCNILYPKLIIPMHYKNSKIKFPLNSCKNFITNFNNINKINSNTINIDTIINSKNQLLLLTPPLV